MSSSINIIDLPSSPLHATTAEGDLRDAPVVATLMDGKTRTGRLAALDGPQASLVLMGKDDNRAAIEFSRLRYLEFLTRHPVSNERHPLEQHAGDVMMPGNSQDFRITYIDDKTFSGRTRGSFVDDVGIHLFQLVGNDKVSRLFIPARVVRKYYIGQRQVASETPDHITDADDRKSTGSKLKRRKSDVNSPGHIASDAGQLGRKIDELATRSGNLVSGMRIGGMLVEEGAITESQLDDALAVQARDEARKIGEILVEMGAIRGETLFRTLAHKFGMPFALLRNFFIDITCLQMVPEDVARKYTIIPLLLHKDRLVVAMDDPANTEAITLLRFITQHKIEPAIATPDDINWAITKYYGDEHDNRTAMEAAPQAIADHNGPSMFTEPSAAESTEEQPSMARAVASFLSNTILDAIERNASDIHLIPTGSQTNLLFRIDGKLIPVRQVSRMLMPSIIGRLAVMCDLPPSPTGGPRQGRTCMLSGDTAIELRITIGPEGLSEGVIIRILNEVARMRSIRDLGLEPREHRSLMEMLTRSYSLLVVCGNRNSGKTHTLYSALRELQAMKHEIMTVETPVKYYISGIEQIQGTDLTAAFGQLKSVKPQVLMIDDLQQPKALQTAAESALNGSLVLGKLHTPNAAGAIAALCAAGVSPRLLNSTLSGVLAQHLIHINCLTCAEEESVAPDIRHSLGVDDDEVFYRGTGCPMCNHTGYLRQKPIFELLRVTTGIQELIRNNASAGEINRHATADGMQSLVDNALYLARMRKTSLSEVHRLMQETQPGSH